MNESRYEIELDAVVENLLEADGVEENRAIDLVGTMTLDEKRKVLSERGFDPDHPAKSAWKSEEGV